MVNDGFGIVAFLLAIEAAILMAAGSRRGARFFNFLPPMFWIYFLPMLLASAGFLPHESPVYTFISANLLPASLALLLVSVDTGAILRLGRVALLMMLAGSFGIMIGAPLVLMMFKPWLPVGIWSGFGALSGSWIGGSANMIAIKEGIGTPDHIFLPMVVVDTIVSYSWMGLIIALAVFQKRFDSWNRSRPELLSGLEKSMSAAPVACRPLELKTIVLLFAFGFLVSGVAAFLAGFLPAVKNLLSRYTWTIIIVTFLGVLLSHTGARRLEEFGASRVGYALLYFVLASIGVRGDLFQIVSAPVLILAGVVWLMIHALILLAAARLLRAPMFFMAVSSQANVGGPVSAPVVAEIYRPGFASVGILMAVLGNITGTFLGIICAQLCRLVS